MEKERESKIQSSRPLVYSPGPSTIKAGLAQI